MKTKILLSILMIAVLSVAAFVYFKSSLDYEYNYIYFGGKVIFSGRYRNSDIVFNDIWVSLADIDSTGGKPPEFFKNDFKIFIRNKSAAINDFTPDEIIRELDKRSYFSDTEKNFDGIMIRRVKIDAEYEPYRSFMLSISYYEDKPISVFYQINPHGSELFTQEDSYFYFSHDDDTFGFPLKQKELISILGEPEKIEKSLLWP